MENAVAYIDLLGFANMVELDRGKAHSILNDFYTVAFNCLQHEPDIRGMLFSDSLLAYGLNKNALIKSICKIYRECIKKNRDYLSTQNFFLMPRGGISFGLMEIEQRRELPNLQKNFIVSPALVHSVKMEQTILGGRLLIAAKTGTQEEMEVDWGEQDSSTILYRNETFELWKGYKYHDCFWFRDLDKECNSQRQEIEELFIKNENIRTKALQHHIATLRIGLLSYSQFIEANKTNDLINRLFTDFKQDKYWMLWLALIEMTMQSPDSWAIPAQRDVIGFYKEVSLSNGWKDLLTEINKPNQSFTKSLVQKFINEISIRTA